MKNRNFCLFAILTLMASSATAGFKDALKGAVGTTLSTVTATVPTVTNTQVVGVSDNQWAQDNNLSAEELQFFKKKKAEWIEKTFAVSEVADRDMFGSSYQTGDGWKGDPCTLGGEPNTPGNKLFSVRTEAGTPVYYIQLPPDAEKDVLWMTEPMRLGRAVYFITSDGFYKADQNGIQFIYYSELKKTDVKKQTLSTESNITIPNVKLLAYGELSPYPLDATRIRTEIAERNEKQIREKAQDDKRSKLADKLDLGPFKLGMRFADLPAGEVVNKYDNTFGRNIKEFEYEFITKAPLVYAGQSVAWSRLIFAEDVLTRIVLNFNPGQDNTVLIQAINERYGQESPSEYDDSTSGVGKITFWRCRDITLCASERDPKHYSLNYKPWIALKTTRFDEQIKAKALEREKKQEAADKAKAAKMMNEL